MSDPISDTTPVAGIRRDRLDAFAAREAKRYVTARPKSRAALAERAEHFLDGLPMHWMKDWPMPFPMLVDRAEGARLTDIDGFGIDDFCLGDTGSLFGHSPPSVARAIRKQARRGLTYMLPTEAALEASALLSAVFGDFRWQIATAATDANRFALRVARAVTGRPKVLVFNGCYHGTVDETMVELRDGRTAARQGLVGQVADLSQT
ncbi:MAG: aminotransferase class III-fold pyridoxal phosphate-dependent enzyme, partial [Gemmobacter sp.]|nr:aminotransferase class III-fold pyridoxal phosphate-dependent enzyme [Gemmobacter sp.]